MPTFSDAPLISLGDKIVTDINAVDWIPSGSTRLIFTARRVYYLTEYEPTDTDLHVDLLLAADDDEELVDRGNTTARTFIAAIGVQKILADRTSQSEMDTLVSFVESLRCFYDLQVEFVVSGTQRARCVKRETPVIYSPDELDKDHRFFSVIHLTFEGWYVG